MSCISASVRVGGILPFFEIFMSASGFCLRGPLSSWTANVSKIKINLSAKREEIVVSSYQQDSY